MTASIRVPGDGADRPAAASRATTRPRAPVFGSPVLASGLRRAPLFLAMSAVSDKIVFRST
jgi:hypothetical protein